MRGAVITALVLVVGVLLLADYLVVNPALNAIAAVAVDGVILVFAGAALAAVGALAWRRGNDLWRGRGDRVGAAVVLVGIGAMLLAGLRPGTAGATDPAVGWLLAALVIPLGATLFGLLFVSTLVAVRHAIEWRSREAAVMLGAAALSVILLLPVGGVPGEWLAGASGWALGLPIGAVFRGLLIGVGVVTAVVAGRALLGIGAADD